MADYTRIFECISEKDTKRLATAFSAIAKKGDIFALYGTLGAGKSTFSRFFIQSLCGTEDVPSPTFTLVQSYEAAFFDIYHYDMYRIKKPEEAYELGIEESFYTGVNLIEWPEKIGYLLPKDVWRIAISAQGDKRVFAVSVSTDDKAKRLGLLNYD